MAKNRQKRKARQRERRRLEVLAQEKKALQVAEDPTADIVAEGKDVDMEKEFLAEDSFAWGDKDKELYLYGDTDEDEEFEPENDAEKSFLVVAPTGPKSLSELDEKREAEKKTWEVRRTTWDTEDVISNIINDPTTEIDTKVTEITSVAQEMKDKINSILGKSKEISEDFDFEVIQAEVLSKGLTKFERLKAKLSKTSLTDLETPTDVRLALVKALKMIKQGGDTEGEARKALPAIREAAKKLGMGQPSKENDNGFVIEKDANGDLRWVGWATNNRRDREGDILADVGHKEFVEFLDNTPQWHIDFLPWHQKELAFTHPVDAWMYKDGFMIYSGKLEEHEAQGLMRVAQKETLGMSHGFIPLRRNGKIIEKFRTFEATVLPLHNAANYFTGLDLIAKEATIMDKKQYLLDLLGEERFEQLSKDTEEFAALLDDQGVESKEVDETPSEETPEVVEDKPEGELELTIDTISKELGMPELSEAFTSMGDEIASLKGLVKILVGRQEAVEEEVVKEAEDKLAEMISTPQAARFAWQRPSESKDTEVSDDDEILKSVPKADNWLSKITHTEPLPKKYVEENL